MVLTRNELTGLPRQGVRTLRLLLNRKACGRAEPSTWNLSAGFDEPAAA